MSDKNQTIESILQLEWTMFQKVNNMHSRAACQDDHRTFRIMRSSQATSWSEETLESYRQDLIEAELAGRNLIAEKYGHMMASTAPLEYEAIAPLMPTVGSAALSLIKQILTIIMQWEVELEQKYPHLLAQGRPLRSTGDTISGVTSLETYLDGELKSYSTKTLNSYLLHVQRMHENNTNGSGVIMLAAMKQYGFKSLEEANDTLREYANRT